MNLPGKLTSSVILHFSVALVLWSTELGAAQKEAPGVQLRIGTILAGNQSEDFDSRLTKMKSQLKVMKYRSYRLIKEDGQKVSWKANAVFEIPGGRSLVVVPQEYRNNRLSLKVRLLEGEKPLLDTTVRLQNRGNFLLGGPPHEGGYLILSISATVQ